MPEMILETEWQKKRANVLAKLSPEEREREEAMELIYGDERLRKIYEDLVEEGRQLVGRGLFYYHKVGLKGNEVRKDAAYGDGAAQSLALALGLPWRTVTYACTFAHWYSQSEVKALLERRNPRGGSLGWGHFQEVLICSSKEDADKLLELTLDRGWSVRRLREEIDQRGTPPPAPVVPLPRTALGAINQALAMGSKYRERLSGSFVQQVLLPLKEVERDQMTDRLARGLKNILEEIDRDQSVLTERRQEVAVAYERALTLLEEQRRLEQEKVVKDQTVEEEEFGADGRPSGNGSRRERRPLDA